MNINFSEVFKKLRRERELTQEQAAEAFSVSTQAVSRWENGQTSPDISLLPIIAEYFGVSIETLLGVDNEKRKALHEQYMNDFETAIKSGNKIIYKELHKKGYFAIIKKLCFDALTGQSGNALKPPDGFTGHVHVRILTGFAHGRNGMI